jgi:uncharacterized lipoprotein YmbA
MGLDQLHWVAFAVAVCGAAAGCGNSEPSRYYILTPMASSHAAQAAISDDPELTVGIDPIELPQYLDRPQIVTRTTRNELQFAEFDRWAEPLGDNFGRVLLEDLSTLLSAHRILVVPTAGEVPPDYRVIVEVTRFDRDAGGDSVLTVRWTVFDGDRNPLVIRESRLSEPVAKPGHAATVVAMNRAVAQLGRDIAAAIMTLPKGA